jgi:hypothetical protein
MLSGIDDEVLLRRAKLWWGAEQGRIRVPRNAMIFAQNNFSSFRNFFNLTGKPDRPSNVDNLLQTWKAYWR